MGERSENLNFLTTVTNRFPSEGALNLETVSFSAKDLAQVVLPPTAPLAQNLELRAVCEAYLRRIPTREKGQGRCFMMRGENGTGKTHALADVSLRVASNALVDGRYQMSSSTRSVATSELSQPGLRRPVVLYAKARGDSESLITVFKDLLARLNPEDWSELGRDAMSVLASGKPASDGDLVQQFLGKLRVDRGTLWGEQSAACY
jgi:hypothetical protein